LNDMLKNVITWGIILLVLMSIFNHYGNVGTTPDELTYTDFLNSVRNGTIAEVTISSSQEGNTIKGRDVNGKEFHTFGMPDPRLVDDLVENNVEITAEPPEQRSVILDLLINIIPVLLLVGLWVYFMRQMQGGGGRGAMSFGKSKAKLQGEDQIKVTFADVAGVEEAKVLKKPRKKLRNWWSSCAIRVSSRNWVVTFPAVFCCWVHQEPVKPF